MSTWAEIKQQVQEKVDTQDEVFVDDLELLRAANRGIKRAEQLVKTLYEGYYMTFSDLVITADEKHAPLPAGIYASKIRELWYETPSQSYEIKPIVRNETARRLDRRRNASGYENFRYELTNDAALGTRIRLYPTPSQSITITEGIKYIRDANMIVDDTTVIDVPEADNFLVQFLCDFVINKERVTPDADDSPALQREQKMLVDTLSHMIPDQNNVIEPDLEFYEGQQYHYYDFGD